MAWRCCHGCRDLLVYCVSPWCNHSATLTLDWLPDDTALLDLDRRMGCTACGLIGADVAGLDTDDRHPRAWVAPTADDLIG
jgi:hypothetical protein